MDCASWHIVTFKVTVCSENRSGIGSPGMFKLKLSATKAHSDVSGGQCRCVMGRKKLGAEKVFRTDQVNRDLMFDLGACARTLRQAIGDAHLSCQLIKRGWCSTRANKPSIKTHQVVA